MPATATIKTRSIQGESLSAVTDRLANTVTVAEGVVNKTGNSFQVLQDTGSNMQIRVGSGTAYDRAVVQGDFSGQGRFVVEHQNATQVLTIAASDPTNPRIDIVILRVYDTTFDSSGNQYADLEVIQGTPAGSPSAPAVPNSAVKLAEVAVAAAATQITNGNITDFREEATTAPLLRAQHNLSTLADNRTGALGWNDTLKALQVGLGTSAAVMFAGGWQTWTPTYGDFTLGNGTVNTARYAQIGKLVVARFTVTFGSTTSITGAAMTVSTPVTASSTIVVGSTSVGEAIYTDTGTSTFVGYVRLNSTTAFRPLITNVAATYPTAAGISSTVPHTWANTDVLSFEAIYEAA